MDVHRKPIGPGGDPRLIAVEFVTLICLCDELVPRSPVDLRLFFFCHANGHELVGKTSFAELQKDATRL